MDKINEAQQVLVNYSLHFKDAGSVSPKVSAKQYTYTSGKQIVIYHPIGLDSQDSQDSQKSNLDSPLKGVHSASSSFHELNSNQPSPVNSSNSISSARVLEQSNGSNSSFKQSQQSHFNSNFAHLEPTSSEKIKIDQSPLEECLSKPAQLNLHLRQFQVFRLDSSSSSKGGSSSSTPDPIFFKESNDNNETVLVTVFKSQLF